MIDRPSPDCWPIREILPLGLILCLAGPDLAVAVEVVDLIVFDLEIPGAVVVEVDLTMLVRATGAPRTGAFPDDLTGAVPADLTVLARELGRWVGVLLPLCRPVTVLALSDR